MIYEMVNGCLDSLANHWRDLSTTFLQLASTLPTGDARIQILDNNVPGPNRGLSQLCVDEEGRITNWRQVNQNLRPALLLFQGATLVFQDSETLRGQVSGLFVVATFQNPPPAGAVEIALCVNQLQQIQEYIARCLQDFEEITSVEGQRFSLSGIRNSAEHIASYPLLTTNLGATSPSISPSSQAPGTGSFQRIIDGALREVLGRLPKPKDPRSFIAALNQSFELRDVEGHTEFTWTQRSYAGQTELGGGVTGGQASLYTRATVALDSARPLLDGLHPLIPDADLDDVEAIRVVVNSELKGVVAELGVEGGPRVIRVDDLFESLLGKKPVPGTQFLPLQSGHLSDLRTKFGLNSSNVNTLDEETNLTNFIALQDYVVSLCQSWIEFRTQFLGKDLGTRLVLLSRALSVSAEAVNEVYAAMDSVFVGPAERQVATFRDPNGNSILVEELLSWVTTFTSEEAPHLVHESGRIGAGAIIAPAQRLEGLVGEFIRAIPTEPSLPNGLRHPRVRYPLEELRGYLRQVQQYAQEVRNP